MAAHAKAATKAAAIAGVPADSAESRLLRADDDATVQAVVDACVAAAAAVAGTSSPSPARPAAEGARAQLLLDWSGALEAATLSERPAAEAPALPLAGLAATLAMEVRLSESDTRQPAPAMATAAPTATADTAAPAAPTAAAATAGATKRRRAAAVANNGGGEFAEFAAFWAPQVWFLGRSAAALASIERGACTLFHLTTATLAFRRKPMPTLPARWLPPRWLPGGGSAVLGAAVWEHTVARGKQVAAAVEWTGLAAGREVAVLGAGAELLQVGATAM